MPKAVVRGCGRRQKGAVYLTVPVNKERGVPLDHFLICPPKPVDPEKMRLDPIGVQLIEVNGVTHVFDWVGATHYPNVADMISEMRRHGVSRRISRTIDFSRLTAESRLVLLHERAIMTNAAELRAILRDEEVEKRPDAVGWTPLRQCPQHILAHTAIPVDLPQPAEMCQSLYWDDVEGGEPVLDPAVPWRTVDRTVGSTTYRARRRPDEFAPAYQVGIFAMLPIHHIAVIRDPDGGRHREAMEKAKQADLPVTLEDE